MAFCGTLGVHVIFKGAHPVVSEHVNVNWALAIKLKNKGNIKKRYFFICEIYSANLINHRRNKEYLRQIDEKQHWCNYLNYRTLYIYLEVSAGILSKS